MVPREGSSANVSSRRTYDRAQAAAAFEAIGVGPGEVIFLSAGFGNLGVFDGADPFGSVLDALRSAVGPSGSIVVPSYSYSFGPDKAPDSGGLPVFSVQETPSSLGRFSEWFRTTRADFRSADPMVSVAVWGPAGESLTRSLPPTSYGDGCIFQRLLDFPTSVVNLGLGTKWTPFIHHIDYLCEVPHRYRKVFRGTVESGATRSVVDWEYHVPVRVPNARGLGEANGLAALDAGLWRWSELGRARVFRASYADYFAFTLDRTKGDPWNLAAGPPIDLTGVERA